jgi:hypothetical protein
VKLTFKEDSVKAELVDLGDTDLVPENTSATKALTELLRSGPKTKQEIDGQLVAWQSKALEQSLTRGRRKGVFYLAGGRWSLGVSPEAAPEDEPATKPKRRKFEQRPLPESDSWDE